MSPMMNELPKNVVPGRFRVILHQGAGGKPQALQARLALFDVPDTVHHRGHTLPPRLQPLTQRLVEFSRFRGRCDDLQARLPAHIHDETHLFEHEAFQFRVGQPFKLGHIRLDIFEARDPRDVIDVVDKSTHGERLRGIQALAYREWPANQPAGCAAAVPNGSSLPRNRTGC